MFLSLSSPAYGEWKNEKVSPEQLGAIVSGRFDGEHDRLFAATNGNIYDGRIFEFEFREGIWKKKLIHAAPGAVSRLSIGSDCEADNSLFLGPSEKSGIIRLRPEGKMWSTEALSSTRPGTSLPYAQILNGKIIALLGGTTITVLADPDIDAPQLKCGEPAPFWPPGSTRPEEIRVLAVGDLRGDGVRRYYGLGTRYGLRDGHYVLLELTQRGKFWQVEQLSGRSAFAYPTMLIGDARGDGKPALYAVFGRGINEIRWNGNSWEKTVIGQVGIAAGMGFGVFRSDHRKRIYIGDGQTIAEYSYERGRWRKELISPGKGVLYRIVSGRAAGQREAGLFFSIMNRGGFYQLKWEDGERVVVAAFTHDEPSAAESGLLVEMIRTRMVQIGNCSILEREQMEKLLAERRFRETGDMSPAYAVRLGKLLNAKKVVVGSVGRLFSSRVATVNSVSVETGEIERSEFAQWNDAGELERASNDLAQSICPADGGAH